MQKMNRFTALFDTMKRMIEKPKIGSIKM